MDTLNTSIPTDSTAQFMAELYPRLDSAVADLTGCMRRGRVTTLADQRLKRLCLMRSASVYWQVQTIANARTYLNLFDHAIHV